MNTFIEPLLKEALAYQAGIIERDEPLDGGDLVEWFIEWRARVQAAFAQGEPSLAGAARREVMPVCSECGSENVCADAAARWNTETREWEVVNVFDKGHSCDDCGGEVGLDWREEGRGRDS